MKFAVPTITRSLVIATIVVCPLAITIHAIAEENAASESSVENSKVNPLRSDLPTTDAGTSPDKSKQTSASKQTVRGKATEAASSGTIDFVIIDPEADSKPTPAQTVSVKESVDEPKQAPSVADNALAELHAEYERLHRELAKAPASNQGIVKSEEPPVFLLGEDTDNPAFDSNMPAPDESVANGSNVPEPLESIVDPDSVMELLDNSIEFPPEDFPETEPTLDNQTELGSNVTSNSEREASEVGSSVKQAESKPAKPSSDDNEHADSSSVVLKEDDSQPLPADVVSRPTLRRPKPITIEPIEEELNGSSASDAKPNTSGKVTASIRPKSDATKGTPPNAPNANASPTKQPEIRIDPAAENRSKRVAATLNHYLANPESATERSPWAVMHAILPFGADTQLTYRNQRVNAIAWMCANRVCKTQTIFSPVGNSFRPNVGGGVQGHEGQFLAILAQTQVSSQYPLYVNNRKFTVADLVHYEMASCKPKTELTFKLIGLSYYLGTKQTWRSRDRQVWDVERLLGEEMAQPVNGAACGGTHRLMGIYFAIEQRKADQMPLTGKYAVAEKYIKDYIEYAWTLQNPDGSFSTNWFESRGMEDNEERKVQTTGHILEWLIYVSSPEDLKRRRVDAAIDFLISKIYDKRTHKWPIGPRGHATRAIALYREKCLEQEPLTLADISVASQATPQRASAPNTGRR